MRNSFDIIEILAVTSGVLLRVDLVYTTKLYSAIICIVKLRNTVRGASLGCVIYLLKYLKYS